MILHRRTSSSHIFLHLVCVPFLIGNHSVHDGAISFQRSPQLLLPLSMELENPYSSMFIIFVLHKVLFVCRYGLVVWILELIENCLWPITSLTDVNEVFEYLFV